MKNTEVYLGSFKSDSGKLMVSDPCYERNVWCQGIIDNSATGDWKAYVYHSDEGDWGIRCAALLAIHSSVSSPSDTLIFQPCDFVVGVDSGQAGIFDELAYRNDDMIDADRQPINTYGESKFYNLCCDLTVTKLGAGVLSSGTVSCSGYGDGGYDCFVAKNQEGQIIAVKVIFL